MPDLFKGHVAKGDIERILPGVYRLAGAAEGPRQKLRAVRLWGGDGTAASHTSAAALMGLRGFALSDLHAVTSKDPRPGAGLGAHPQGGVVAIPTISLVPGAVRRERWETHGTREAFQADRERDRRLQNRGWSVLHYTSEDVRCRPREVLGEIGKVSSGPACGS